LYTIKSIIYLNVISEKGAGNAVEVVVAYLTNILAFTWRDREPQKKSNVRITGFNPKFEPVPHEHEAEVPPPTRP
jgi:hypothetical protein